MASVGINCNPATAEWELEVPMNTYLFGNHLLGRHPLLSSWCSLCGKVTNRHLMNASSGQKEYKFSATSQGPAFISTKIT